MPSYYVAIVKLLVEAENDEQAKEIVFHAMKRAFTSGSHITAGIRDWGYARVPTLGKTVLRAYPKPAIVDPLMLALKQELDADDASTAPPLEEEADKYEEKRIVYETMFDDL